MRDYGKVHASFWTSSNIRELSEDGRTLAIYLLTCPHGTIAGVFRLPDGYACEDLQWESERVRATLAELFRNGFATRCEATKWVWVTKHLEWNPPENPNQRKAAAKMVAQIPDNCAWKVDFIGKCGQFFGIQQANSEPLRNPSETLSQPVAVTVAVTETVKGESTARASRMPADQALLPDWREFCRHERPDLDPEATFAKFRDYWIAKPGRQGTKLDWLATWRNWVREEKGKATPSEPSWRTEQRRRTLQAVPGIADRGQSAVEFFDVEAKNVTATALG